MIQPAIAKIGAENLNTRSKFMIETLINLKNNKSKLAAATSVVSSEAVTRMKKMLGSLNTRQLRATEPLRPSLEDIKEVNTRGKWWLIGASWRNDTNSQPQISSLGKGNDSSLQLDGIADDDESTDLMQLARQQRMNTDVRRAIFVTIMSSEVSKISGVDVITQNIYLTT